MRIGFVHTVASLVDDFRADMTATHPQIDTFHILNESILQELGRGEPRSQVYRRVVQLLLLAADSGADLIVYTCSGTAPAVDVARPICPVPILKLADPMAAEAVRLGRRIALICTNTNTPGPASALLRQHAAVQGSEVIVETVVRPEAYTALFTGDRARHDALLTEAAQEVLPRADLLVLPQGTLAYLQGPLQKLGKPVLSSRPLLMAELTRRLAPEQAPG